MLTKCLPLLHVVMRSALIKSSLELHRLLDMMDQSSVDTSHQLKRFLQRDLIPLLEGTSFDRTHEIREMQAKTCQLLQDAALSARLLRASPGGRYVRALLDCILHDHARMHALHRLTSSQASQMIECLCAVGVRDRAVYAVLAARLDFRRLWEIAQVMFAFAESGLHDVMIRQVVPLYSKEAWTLTSEPRPKDGPTSRSTRADDFCNVFEAVRVLRVLSTSLRAVFLSKPSSPSTDSDAPLSLATSEALPYKAINTIRNSLCLFILENDSVMRGAHWINFVRALVNFPQEYQVLDGLKEHPKYTSVVGKFAADMIRDQPAKRKSESAGGVLYSDVVMGYDLALIGMAKFFDFAEARRILPGNKILSEMGKDSLPEGSPGRTVVNHIPFDCGLLDLIKLLPLLNLVPCAKSKRESRFSLVLETLRNHANTLQFGSLVKLLNVLCTMGTTFNMRGAIQEIATEAGKQLKATSSRREVERIRIASVLSFASILCQFRIRGCYGFVQFMKQALPILPNQMSPDEVANCLSAIALSDDASSESTKSIVRAFIRKLKRFLSARNGKAENSSSLSPALLGEYPIQCVEMMRVMALFQVLPEEEDLCCFLGNPARGQPALRTMSSAVRNAGAALLLDLSRAFGKFGRQATANAVDGALLSQLWRVGVLGTLLPLLTEFTEELVEKATAAPAGALGKGSFPPIAWSSAMRTVFFYVDTKMGTCSFEMMATRLDEAYTLTKSLAMGILRSVDVEISNARYDTSYHLAEERQSSSQPSFPFSMVAHMLTYVLIWEFMLCEGSYSAKQRLLATDLPDAEKKIAERVLEIKEDYIKFLEAPLSDNSNDAKSPMDIVRYSFGIAQTGPNPSPPNAGGPWLEKSQVLEITNSLPFAVSLALYPGPVNDFFSEHSASLIIDKYLTKD